MRCYIVVVQRLSVTIVSLEFKLSVVKEYPIMFGVAWEKVYNTEPRNNDPRFWGSFYHLLKFNFHCGSENLRKNMENKDDFVLYDKHNLLAYLLNRGV